MTNSVRNSAMPVSTVFGGDICMPSAFRVSDSTTMILVNDVASSSTAGATESTVIARISVIEVLGLPPPIEMSTPPSTVGTTGAVEHRAGQGAGGAGHGRLRGGRPPLGDGLLDDVAVHLGEQGDLLLGGADDQHAVGDADDADAAGPAHALPGDDLDEAVALAQAALLREPRGEPEDGGDEGQREHQPDDHPRHGWCPPISEAAASVMISLIRRPKSSSTTTTSPRAISVPLTSRSAGALAARSSSTTSPGCSESSSPTVIRVRPISTVTSMATCRSSSRLPREPPRAWGRVTWRAKVAWHSPAEMSGTATNMPLSRRPS